VQGCKDSVSHCGEIINDERVYFPSAFSPNNDMNNDEFKPIITNIDLATLKNYSFIIANRFGDIIFKSDNPYFGWDGTLKGSQCEIGTYYYFCKFTSSSDKVYIYKGDVTIIY
jgi:gliding motility-associated-like protein